MLGPLAIVAILLLASQSSLVSASGELPVDSLTVKFLDTINPWLDKLVVQLTNQEHNNENGTRAKYRDLVLTDHVNDDLQDATVEELVQAAGFLYERHEVVTVDQYVTYPIRIVNPLVKKKHLRRVPVMFIHGGTLDAATFIWASVRQHHPERYPRRSADGPFTSSNRSLPFVLANQGYDVWLITSRGSNKQNQDHLVYKTHLNHTAGVISERSDRMKYWQFSMDEIVDLELPAQIDKVLEVSRAKKVSIVALSVGTQLTLSMLASNEQYAAKVNTFVAMGPPYSANGMTHGVKKYLKRALALSKPPLLTMATMLLTEFLIGEPMHNLLTSMSKGSKKFIYSFLRATCSLVMGPSPTYQTFFEAPVYGHLVMPTSAKLAIHFAQQLLAGKLQRYDYGWRKNRVLYNSSQARVYDTSDIHIKRWLVVAGSNDRAAPMPSTHDMIRDVIKPKATLIEVVGHNHLDLVSAVDNDVLVNLPILKYLNKFH